MKLICKEILITLMITKQKNAYDCIKANINGGNIDNYITTSNIVLAINDNNNKDFTDNESHKGN